MIITDPESLCPHALNALNALGDNVGSLLSTEIEVIASIPSGDVAKFDNGKVYATPAAFGGKMIKLIEVLGKARWYRLTPAQRLGFDMKLVKADPSICSSCEEMIKNGTEPRKLYPNFADAVSRLTAIHIGNALLSNSDFLLKTAFNVNPCLADFVSGERRFSLTPLLSVYCKEDGLDFCKAVSAHVRGTLDSMVSERSTFKAYESLIKSLL